MAKGTTPRYRVVGKGRAVRSKWCYTDEREIRAFRIFLMEDTSTGDKCYGADYRVMGHIVESLVPLAAATRTQAWGEARKGAAALAIPDPKSSHRSSG